jgi:hypothetical protein
LWVALLLRKRTAGLDALGGVGDGAVEGRPAGAEAEGGHHQARVAEDGQGLGEPLPLDAAHQGIGVHPHAGERDLGRVAGADAVLVLGPAVGEARRALLDHEPRRAAGRPGEHAVEVGEAAVADPLLVAVEPVADDRAALDQAGGRGAQRRQIAAGLGLGGGVGHEQALRGDAGEPALPLLLGAAEADGIAAQQGGEDAGGDPEIDARQGLADLVDVEGPTAHAAVLFGDEEELDAQILAAHPADEVVGELVSGVEVEDLRVGEVFAGEVLDRLEGQLQRLAIESCGHPPPPEARERRSRRAR